MAEFDAYAEGYAAGMDQPLKRLAGRSADEFIDVKTRFLLRDWAGRGISAGPARPPATLLDFGCGTGAMLRSLRRHGYAGGLTGCDVSAGMLDRARALGPADATLVLTPDGGLGGPGVAPGDAFDAAVVSAVLHHVPLADRPGLLAGVRRRLRPGGRLYVFEHNGRNPLVRHVVGRTPIDKDARLLTAPQTAALCAAAGLTVLGTRSLMFFPPRWRWPRLLERPLGRVPLGGQYVVVATP